MSVISYKCPGCGAPLTYDPNAEKTACKYCFSSFSLEELEEYNQKLLAKAAETEQQEAARSAQVPDALKGYTCNSCGAEVVTDETTAATFCYYCHNPVILSDRLGGDFRPQKIIPFTFDRQAAEAQFLKWARTKKFVPKSFYSDSQMEKLTGMYLPFWLADANTHVNIAGTGISQRIWTEGNTEYTENSHYDFAREGQFDLKNVSKLALNKIEPELINSVANYDEDNMKDFSMLYLSGFFSETYEIDQKTIEPQIEADAAEHIDNLINDSLSNYDRVDYKYKEINTQLSNWQYALFPTWVMTYNYGGRTYVYAVNGQSGQAYGELPLDKTRLGIYSGIIFIVIAVLLLLGGYFIW